MAYGPRESLLIEPPRRLWRTILGGVALFLAGGFVGVMLTVELLTGEPPSRPAVAARSGADMPMPPANSAPAEQLRREAERMQANGELAALRQAAVAERARLDSLAQQRREAETALAELREQAQAEAPAEPQPQARPEPAPAPPPPEPVPAPVADVPPPAPAVAVATPAPPAAVSVGPSATPRQGARGRAEARGETRGEARPDARADGRVQLHYLAGSPAARQAAEDAAAVLRDAGVEGVELRPVAEVPGDRLVRYHRAEDAGAAARLAGRLGRGWALQDSRGYDPGGTGRSLDVWLPDR